MLPGLGQEGGGPAFGGQVQGAERFGEAFDAAFGSGGGLADVGTVRGDAHEQVGPGARAQLPLPGGQVVDGLGGEVVGQGGDVEAVVVAVGLGLGEHFGQVGTGEEVVGAVHPQHVAGEGGAVGVLPGLDPADQLGAVVGQVGAVGVAVEQVLGPHPRAVGGVPPEGVAVHRGGHAPPHHGVFESQEAEQLGHLGDMAEHVGQVAHGHGTPEVGRALEAHGEVADEGLARHEELVGQRVPGAHRQAPGGGQGPQAVFGLGAYGQVVVDRGHLAVELEVGEGGVCLQQVEQAVDEIDELEPEALERLVPLTVPVGVGDDGDSAGHASPRRFRSGDGRCSGAVVGGYLGGGWSGSVEAGAHHPSTTLGPCASLWAPTRPPH